MADAGADRRLIDLLIGDVEGAPGAQDGGPDLLTAAIVSLPEDYLWNLGSQLVLDDDDDRSILGTRLIRELADYKDVAACLLNDAWAKEISAARMYWIVAAFGFIPSDLVVDKLLTASKHPLPMIRDEVAAALSNVTAERCQDDVRSALFALAQDLDPEVRFSAMFEVGVVWRRAADPAMQQLLEIAAASDPDPRIVSSSRAALGLEG